MYDVIIIGAGPAGISASLYTIRNNLKTLVIYNESSALEKATKIENYYGFKNGISGEELYQAGIKQAKNLGIDVLDEEVTSIQLDFNNRIDIKESDKTSNQYTFKIKTLNKEYSSKAVILATGSKRTKPNIKNVEKFEGKGVSYCAICDGFFYKNKTVAVIGNGDYALSTAKELQNLTQSITIYTNGMEKPEHEIENIKINTNKIIEIEGQNKAEKIKFENGQEENVDGIFIAEGIAGSSDFAKELGARIQNQNIVVNENMETTVKGLFACGDCVGGLSQVVKTTYDGAKAGISASSYLMK